MAQPQVVLQPTRQRGGQHWSIPRQSADSLPMSALGNLDMTYHNDWLQLPGSNNVFADFTTVHNPAISLAANSRSHGHDTQARSFQGDSYLIPDSFQQQTPHATAQNPPPVSFDAFSTAPTKRQGLPKQTTSERPNKRTRTRQWDNTWGYLDVDTSNMFGHDDDDAQSVCSTCSDTCPSHCGETGPGGLCCDADDCEAQATEELCIDEACEGANNPCTDENCLGDALTPSGTREEAAAAAALTSFNDIGDLNSIGSFTEGNQFGSFGNDFSLGPNQQLTGQASHGMDFSNMHTAPDAQFNMLSTDSVATASSNGQNMAWTWPPNLEYLNHLVQYHDPSQDNTHHMRPCLADYPSFVGTKCPLPAPNYDTNDLNDIWSQNPDIQCGYSAQDPAIFADHLKTQHKTFISNFTGFDLGPISWGQTQQGNYNSAQEFSDASQANHNLQTTSFQGTGPDANSRGSRQISSSTPSGTITSTRTAPLPTPVSPLSPPLFEHPHPKLESPQPPMTIDRHQHQSLGLENAYQCFWKDPKTGETCLENFKDSDELHDHCKNEHTKISAKAEDGFRCMWHSCRREDECFATKAKLNRHLQTHTGFKPMECPICGMKLSAKQALDQHIRTHTKEQPYVCKFGCGRTFKQHSALTMHHRTHTKEKPLQCDVCGALFTESSNLSKHRRIHSVRGMYQCELCNKDFHRLDQLRRHLASNHKDRPQDAERAIEKAKSLKKKHPLPGHRPGTGTTPMSSASPASLVGLARSGSDDFFADDVFIETIKLE